MKLKIGDNEFKVLKATLSAYLGDPHAQNDDELNWSISIECEEKEIDEMDWEPLLTREELKAPVFKWTDLADKQWRWEVPYDYCDDSYGILYVYEHELIPVGSMLFGSVDGNTIGLTWKGRSNVFENEFEFLLTCKLDFEGLIADGNASDTRESIEKRLHQQIGLEDFEFESFEVSMEKDEDFLGASRLKYKPKSSK
jgi:hypothetical protein